MTHNYPYKCTHTFFKVVAMGLVACFALAGSSAQALLTEISPNTSDGTKVDGPGGVLDILYGRENLIRIDDYDADTTDSYWTITQPENAIATARAKYAGFKHKFGYMIGQSGSGFNKLFDSGKQHFGLFDDDSHSGEFENMQADDIFRLGLELCGKHGWRWSSLPSENEILPAGQTGDAMDHVVTWLITGTSEHAGNYVVAWEDLSADNTLGNYDGDYNDLVVELAGVAPVPEPAPWIIFALSTVFLLRRRKRLNC